MKYENLLKPGKIGPLELKNRVVLPAMDPGLAEKDGGVNDGSIQWYSRIARGGAALVIVGGTCAATEIDRRKPVSHIMRADDPSLIPGLTRLADAIHKGGAKAGIQLVPGPGAQGLTGGPWDPDTKDEDVPMVAPSEIPALGHYRQASRVPRVLTIEEIERLVELCGITAGYIKQAGFDLIQIHGHGGYLVAEFLSGYFNKRTDKYGGNLENRCRFLLEIIDSMRKAIGPDMALTVKYSIEEFLPGGRDTKESQFIAQRCEEAGVNSIDISSGVYGGKLPACPPYIYPRGCLIPFTEAIKEVVNIPVMGIGRLDDPNLAEQLLKDGKADFIAEGRALIADPDWPQKVASGQIKEIRPCLACNECRQNIITDQPVRCTVNAAAGREAEYEILKPAEVKKKVLVVGGGPGGMEAARVAALRGHQVILCEKQRQVGGLMLLGGVHNEEITAFVKWMVAQIKKLPVEVRLQTEVTPALVEEIKPDAVILANGGTFVHPEIPGIDRNNVFSAEDLLKLMNGIPVKKGILNRMPSTLVKRIATASRVNRMLSSNFPIKKTVAVIGGQFPGCSLALLLAKKGKKVTIIEESDSIGKDMEAHTMVGLMLEVEDGNVKVLTSAKIDEITNKGIVVVDDKGNKTLNEADTVLVALDLAPSDSDLAEKLKGKVKEIYTIGDVKSFRRMPEAIAEGYATAYNL